MQGSRSPVSFQLAHGYLILNLSNFSNLIKTKQAISPISWVVYWPTSFHFRCISFSSILFFFIFYYRHGWRHISYMWIFSWSLNISIIIRPYEDRSPPPRGCQMGMSMFRQLWFILVLCQSWQGYLVGQQCQRVTAAPNNLHNLSVLSDSSGCSTLVYSQSNQHCAEEKVKGNTPNATPRSQQRWPMIPKDNFGHAHMIAILEYKGLKPNQPIIPLDPVDKLLFGAPLDLDSLHLQVQDIYASGFKQLDEMSCRPTKDGRNGPKQCDTSFGLKVCFCFISLSFDY